MTKPFKPQLAASEEVSKVLDSLPYPLGMSAKLDGIRGVNPAGVLVSRELIPIPSLYAQGLFSGYQHYDGELIAGDPWHPEVYNRTYRAVMGVNAVDEELKLYVFDHFENPHKPWEDLLKSLKGDDRVVVLEQKIVTCPQDVLDCESELLEIGYEGAILRRFDATYKFGRSTVGQAFCLKLKRHADDEGQVVGFEEGQTNLNEATKDNLGHTKRSSHAENKVPNGRVGKFLVMFEGRVRKIATGTFKHTELKEIWENQGKYMGMWLKFRHFPHGAMDDLRHARARGWRSPIDMGKKKK